MKLKNEREQVVQYAKKALARGLTRGTGGNFSILDRGIGLFAITPSGVEYETMRAGDVAVLDLEGKTVEGALAPSSEKELHRACYIARADVNAAVHTHSTFASTLACMGREIESVHYLVAWAGVRVRLAPYRRFGTKALADAAVDALMDDNAILLANHGLLAVGCDMAYAFNAAEEVEFAAELYYRCLVAGGGNVIPEDEMKAIIPLFKKYGR